MRTGTVNSGANRSHGFSLIELMIALVVAGMLMTVALPAYNGYIDRANVARAIGDIGSISLEMERFRLQNADAMPLTLNELKMDIPLDPWGRSYEYLDIVGAGPGKGGLRKDGKLNPLNSDFDLYSVGKDGKSVGPLSAKKSHDDVVRANNGAFIGLGEDY
jgi:general secretion pathway protein G